MTTTIFKIDKCTVNCLWIKIYSLKKDVFYIWTNYDWLSLTSIKKLIEYSKKERFEKTKKRIIITEQI